MIEAAEHPGELAALVPVFNHSAQVGAVVRDLRALGLEVHVVDDGSTDGSGDIAAASGAVLHRLPVNRGKGAALRHGFRRLAAAGHRRVLTCDADGQHPPEACRLLMEEPAVAHRIVIGRREMAAAPAPNRFGRSFCNLWVRITCGVDPGDSQSGLRIYPLSDVESLPVRADRYHYEVEVLVRAVWAGLTLHPVSVPVRYPAERVSHFRPLLDNLRVSLTFARLVTRRLVPWPHRRLAARQRRPWREVLYQELRPGPAAAGCALGAAMGVAPVPGLQMALAGYLAWRLRLNVPLVLLASNISFGPLLGFWAVVAVAIGACLRLRLEPGAALAEIGREWDRLDWHDLHGFVGLRFGEWLLGGLVLMPVVAVVAGLVGWGIFAGLAWLRRRTAGEGVG